MAAALAAGSFSAAAAQQSEAAFRTTTLNLSAQGEAHVKPDLVRVSLGVTTEAATAQQAASANAAKMAAVTAALRRAGLAPRDLQTQLMQLMPRYSDRSNTPREIVAYQATTMMSVTLRDFDRAGSIVDTAVAAGANQVSGVRPGLADPSAAQREARDEALRALQTDAAKIADVMGQRVVRLISVNTQAYALQVPVVQHHVEELVVTGSRIEPGELSVRAGASGVFELAPK
jgi:hypothetical protein